jgi:hypothetical protein
MKSLKNAKKGQGLLQGMILIMVILIVFAVVFIPTVTEAIENVTGINKTITTTIITLTGITILVAVVKMM